MQSLSWWKLHLSRSNVQFQTLGPGLWIEFKLLEDDFILMIAFDWGEYSMEDNLRGKIIFDETTYDGRQPLMEDFFQWKKNFEGRRISMEDEPQWNMTFKGRLFSIEDILRLNPRKTPHLDLSFCN